MPNHNSRAQRTLSIFLTILLTSTALVGALPSAGAQEACDPSLDPNCDGGGTTCDPSVDATCGGSMDSDGDGYDYTVDCNDSDSTINPGATDTPDDGIDQDCDGVDATNDADGDGYYSTSSGGDDCNDSDSTINPGAYDWTDDGIDQDCDGVDATNDADGDSYYSTSSGGDDCNDSDATIYPGATDTPDDGIDQDCDGVDATSASSLPDLTTTGFTGPTSAIAGDTVSYTATIQNNGGSDPNSFSVYLYNTYSGVEQLITHGDVASLASGTSTDVTLTFLVSEGTYYLKVVPWPSEEANWADNNATATLTVTGVPPANDDFVNATVIATDATTFTDSVSTVHATDEVGESSPCAGISNTVWYRWTAPADGSIDVAAANTESSDYDSALAAYRGTSLESLTLLACDDDSGPGLTSALDFAVTAGETYHFQVGGFYGDTGSMTFTLHASDATPVDQDGDGYAVDQGDCNDSSASVYPGAAETTDGVDNDCDGLVDEIAPPAEFTATVLATIPTRSDDAVFGVNASATADYDTGLDVAEPPAPPEAPWVRAFFAYPANPTVTELTTSFAAPAVEIEWPLVVESHYSTDGSTTAAHDVTLTWNPASFSALYPDFVVLLIDGMNEVDMTTQSSYVFSHAGGDILTRNNFASRAMTIRLEATTPDLTIGTISQYTEGFGHGRIVEGRTTTFSVPVSNVGLRGATDGVLELYNGTTLLSSVDLPAIASNDVHYASVAWTPVGTSGDVDLTFIVSGVTPAERTVFLENNTQDLSVFVEDYEVGGVFTTAARDFMPAETLNYTLQATNNGNVHDTLTVVAASSDSRFTITVEPAYLSLESGESGTFWVNVTAPYHHEFNEVVTTITATVASSTDNLEQATTTVDGRLLPTYQLTVPAGWSLVSFPVKFRDETVTSAVLEEADAVWNWTGAGYVEPTTVAGGYGYWVYVSVETTFNLTGYKLDGIRYEDHPTGWHLIGGTAADLATVVNETGEILNGLYSWTGVGYELGPLNAAIGKGYWMFVESTTATVRVGTMSSS